MCQQQCAGLFKCIQRQGTRNCREAFEKFVQRFTALQIVEKGLNRHAGTPKNRDAMHGFGVLNDRVRHAYIVAQSA